MRTFKIRFGKYSGSCLQSIKRPPPSSLADSLPISRAEHHKPAGYLSSRSQMDFDKTSDSKSEETKRISRPKTKLDNESLSLPEANEAFENQDRVSNLEYDGDQVLLIDAVKVIPDNSVAGNN